MSGAIAVVEFWQKCVGRGLDDHLALLELMEAKAIKDEFLPDEYPLSTPSWQRAEIRNTDNRSGGIEPAATNSPYKTSLEQGEVMSC